MNIQGRGRGRGQKNVPSLDEQLNESLGIPDESPSTPTLFQSPPSNSPSNQPGIISLDATTGSAYKWDNGKFLKMKVYKDVIRFWLDKPSTTMDAMTVNDLKKCITNTTANVIEMQCAMTTAEFDDWCKDNEFQKEERILQVHGPAIENVQLKVKEGNLRDQVVFSVPCLHDGGDYRSLIFDSRNDFADSYASSKKLAKAKTLPMYISSIVPSVPTYVIVRIILRGHDTTDQYPIVDAAEATMLVKMTEVTAANLGVVYVMGSHMIVAYGPYEITGYLLRQPKIERSFAYNTNGELFGGEEFKQQHQLVYYTMPIQQMCNWEAKLLDDTTMLGIASSLLIPCTNYEHVGCASLSIVHYKDLVKGVNTELDAMMAMMASPRQPQMVDERCLRRPGSAEIPEIPEIPDIHATIPRIAEIPEIREIHAAIPGIAGTPLAAIPDVYDGYTVWKDDWDDDDDE